MIVYTEIQNSVVLDKKYLYFLFAITHKYRHKIFDTRDLKNEQCRLYFSYLAKNKYLILFDLFQARSGFTVFPSSINKLYSFLFDIYTLENSNKCSIR